MKVRKGLTAILCFFVVACGEITYIGNSATGYKEIPALSVSPAMARKKAEPWLDTTYRLRLKGRQNNMTRPLYDTIILRGSWYYVSRDNYPYKAIRAYLYHAVRVHVKTGEVIPPKEN